MIKDDEKEVIAWQKGVKYGIEHSQSAPETKERLIKLETYMEQNTKEHQEIKDSLKEIKDEIKKALETKADKSEVETTKEDIKNIKGDIRWTVYTVVGCVIAGVIAFVFFNK